MPDRQVFTAIVYVLANGCAWRDLPPTFGVPFQTAHHRGGGPSAGLRRRPRDGAAGSPLHPVMTAANDLRTAPGQVPVVRWQPGGPVVAIA